MTTLATIDRALASIGTLTVLSCLAAVLALGLVADASAETWRGLTVAPEHCCAPYDKTRDYPYPQSVERDIVRELGAVYGPIRRTRIARATGPGWTARRQKSMRSQRLNENRRAASCPRRRGHRRMRSDTPEPAWRTG